MPPSFVDIENEFDEIAHLETTLRNIDSNGSSPTSQDIWERTLICASASEKIYTGCERVMGRLAADIDGARVTHSDG